MTKVLFIGGGSLGLASRLAMALSPEICAKPRRRSDLELRSLDSYGWVRPIATNDDPFHGGCRSKGEKKRAAKERRAKGGY